jgi:hypothetical protein
LQKGNRVATGGIHRSVRIGRQRGPTDPRSVVSVLVMRLRKKFESQDVQIKTRNGVGYYMPGYYMPIESKKRLQIIIEQGARHARISISP